MPAKRIWTTDEDNYIKENYTKMTYKDLGIVVGACSYSVMKRVRELDLPRQKAPKASVNKKFFSEISNERAYWAGFIAADGCLYERYKQVSFELQLKDYVQLLKFAQSTGYTGKVSAVNRKGKGWSAQMYIAGVEQWFRDLGNIYNIYPRKSLTLVPPNLVCQEHILSYIKGYIDGDGCVGKYKATHQDRWDWLIRIDGTYEVLSYIKDQFDSLLPGGGKVASVNGVKRAKHFLYAVRGTRAEKLLSLLLSINTPCLDRKWNKFREDTYEKEI